MTPAARLVTGPRLSGSTTRKSCQTLQVLVANSADELRVRAHSQLQSLTSRLMIAKRARLHFWAAWKVGQR
jgi:hypothetical protein